MLVNQFYIKNLVIYGTNDEIKKPVNPYQMKAQYKREDILNELIDFQSDYFNISIDEDIKEVRANHIEANKRKNKIFVYDQVLYLPSSLIIDYTTKEKREESHRGCVAVSYDELLTLNNKIKIIVKDSQTHFAKPSDPIDKNHRQDIKDLEEEIKDWETAQFLPPHAKERKERIIKLYKDKIKEGYKYRVITYQCVTRITNKLYCVGYIDHYEKTPEYIKSEKLLKDFNKISSRWGHDVSMSEWLEIEKHFTITRKRGTNKNV